MPDPHTTSKAAGQMIDLAMEYPAGHLYEVMPREHYDGIKAINASLLKKMQKTTLQADHELNQDKPKNQKALTFGSAAHTWILENHLFETEFVVMPPGDRRKKEVKEQWAEALATGKDPISNDEFDTLKAMETAIRNHPVADSLLRKGLKEASIVSKIEGYGETKCRIDVCDVEQDTLVDLKTCQDVSFDKISRTVWDYHYALQARFYLNCYEEVTGRSAKFFFVFIQKEPPYDINCIELNNDWLKIGQKQIDVGLAKHQTYSTFGPQGISDTISTLVVPNYLTRHIPQG